MVLRTPTPEDGVVGKAGAREELLDRTGLSDARVADQREEAAASGARVLEAAQERAQLGLAADEHAAVAALRMPRHPTADRFSPIAPSSVRGNPVPSFTAA